MSTSQSNAALPLSHPPSPEQPQPRVSRYDLPDAGKVLYIIRDHLLRETEVKLPAELATEATEEHIDLWLERIVSRIGQPARSTVSPSACRVLSFPSPPADP